MIETFLFQKEEIMRLKQRLFQEEEITGLKQKIQFQEEEITRLSQKFSERLNLSQRENNMFKAAYSLMDENSQQRETSRHERLLVHPFISTAGITFSSSLRK